MTGDAGQIVCEEGPFPGRGAVLYRRTFRPTQNALARLAIVHGYGDHGGRYAHFMHWMAGRGIACHALDLRGQGRSDGVRGHVARWDEYLDDLAWFLSLPQVNREAEGPLFVLGHSHGGLIVAAAGVRRILHQHGVRGAILCSPFLVSRLRHQRWNAVLARVLSAIAPALRLPTGLRDEWMTRDPAMIADTRADELCVRTATPRWYLGHLRAQRQVMSNAPAFGLPLLLLAGVDDPVADPAGAQRFAGQCGTQDKTLRLLNDRLHELLRESDRETTFQEILDWIRQRSSSTT